ncbi:MAG: type II toxin-antitoxin system VapC family toxin [Chlamydiae bacterium]|nr:type II toxin-antitoxin system VapC family toxin [Chlamydiota bacterium]MBI3277242.1 type II toxin-antitoxin system VapC family toxin [Chlamydiota bacterium]
MIFIDTSAFLPRFTSRDQYHALSSKYWSLLENSDESHFTSNFVLDEMFTLLARRTGYCFAAERAKNLYSSKRLIILRPDEEDELNAIVLFEKYADQKVSFTDCISFVLMKRRNIQKVFTFDKHFKRAGFEIVPSIEL